MMMLAMQDFLAWQIQVFMSKSWTLYILVLTCF